MKPMQDRTPHAVRCSACGAEVIPAEIAKAYRQRDIDEIVRIHKLECKASDARGSERE